MKQEPLNRLTVMVTDDCNLSCKGCVTDAQAGKQGDRSIDVDFVNTVLERYGDNFRDSESGLVYLFFSGRGEPTLRMDTIREIRDSAAKTLGKNNLYVSIQTNGVFNDETSKEVADIADLVWMSVDGAPQDNDYIRRLPRAGERKGSSGYVSRNTPALQKEGVEVRWRSTIHESNTSPEQQQALVDYAKELGVRTVVVEPVIQSPSLENNDGSIYLVNLERFVEGFMAANKYAHKQGITYTTGLMEEAAKVFRNGKGKRCGECFSIDPKTMMARSATLTTDGRIAGCYLGYEDKLRMQSLTIGKWENGQLKINYPALENLTQEYREQNSCHGRSLIGNSEVNLNLLKRISTAHYPDQTPRHS